MNKKSVRKSGKKGQKYPKFHEGDAVDFNWRKKDFNFMCCDCGLVHTLRFAVKGHLLRMRAWRDNKATANARRSRVCTWTYEGVHDYHQTSCGNAHCFMDGDIELNNYKYCPFCGKKIKEKLT